MLKDGQHLLFQVVSFWLNQHLFKHQLLQMHYLYQQVKLNFRLHQLVETLTLDIQQLQDTSSVGSKQAHQRI